MARLAPAPGCDRVLCGVNSFGIAGANAFALLAAADTAPFTAPVPGARALALPPPSLPAFIVPLLATSRDALLESAAAWAAFGAAPASRLSAVLQSPPPGFEGAAIEAAVRTHCATCPMLTRGFFTHRTALVGVPGGLATAQPIADVLPFLPMTLGRKPRGGLVFGGQGALSSGAGDQLYAALPAFREAAHAFSDAYAATPGGVQLLAPRSPGAAAAASAVPWCIADAAGALPTETDDVRLTLPAATLLQCALWHTLARVGVAAAAAAGHSAGEALAAHAAGHLTLAQLCQLVAARAAAMAQLPPGGGMAALMGDRATVLSLLVRPEHAGVHVAAVNGPTQVTVGGPTAALDALLAAAPSAGLRGARLRVSAAFHGPDLDGVEPAFRAALAAAGWSDDAAPVPPADGGFVSSTTGATPGAPLTTAHWWANARAPVAWEGAAATLASRVDLVLELSPRVTLAPCWGPAHDGAAPIVPCARSPTTALADTFTALAAAWSAGVDLEWCHLLGPGVPGAPILPIAWAHSEVVHVETDTHGALPVQHHSARGRTPVSLKLAGRLAPLNAAIPTADAWVHPEGVTPSSAPTAAAAALPAVPAAAAAAALPAVSAATAPPAPPAAATLAAPVPSPPTARPAMTITTSPAPPDARLPVAVVATFEVPPYCADHVIAGVPCVPGVAYVSYTAHLAAATGAVPPGGVVILRDFSVARMVSVDVSHAADQAPVRMELTLGADGAMAARVNRGGDTRLVPRPAVTGSVSVAAAPDAATAALAADLVAAALAARKGGGFDEVNPRHFYRYMNDNSALQHRKSYHLPHDMLACESSREGAAWVTVPPADALTAGGALASDTGVLHPVVLDACTHVTSLAGLVPTPFFAAVPVSYEAIVVWPTTAAAATGAVRAFTRLRTDCTAFDTESVFDLTVADAAGAPAVMIQGLHARVLRSVGTPPMINRVVGVPLDTTTPAAAAAAAAALPAGTVAWLGPAALLAAIMPHDRRTTDIVLTTEAVPTTDAALAPALTRASAVFDARGDVWAAAALLRAAPPAAAIITLLVPPHTLDSARVEGWARTAAAEQKKRRIIPVTAAACPAASIAPACLTIAMMTAPLHHAVIDADGAVSMDRLQRGWTPLPRPPDTPWLRQPVPVALGPRWRYAIERPGQIGSIKPRRAVPDPLLPGQVRLRVRAAALQFKDVMLVLGMLPGVPGDIGGEIVGDVVEMHPTSVAAFPRLKLGDRVAGLLIPPHGALASHAVAMAVNCAPAPPNLDDARVAGGLCAWATVLYALRDRARLARGETVLIHSALGGVGTAAMSYAALLGCRIIASAGSPAKRSTLAAMPGIVAVLDSRDEADWRSAVDDATVGRGVDIVLNSLAGGKQAAGLQLLAQGGRFVEIGKRDAVEGGAVSQSALLKNGSFVSAHIDFLSSLDHSAFVRLLGEVVAGLGSGALAPLPTTVLPMADVASALRTLSRGLHTGKLVLEAPPGWASPGLDDAPLYVPLPANEPLPLVPRVDDLPSLPLDEAGTLVVSGATSGVGLAFCAECMRRGARRVLGLTSRDPKDIPHHAKAYLRAQAAAAGATITFARVDLTDLADVVRVLQPIPKTTPIQVIAHFANVYVNDSASAPVPAASEAWRVKVEGALNLHRATAALSTVRAFLVASSMARVLGAELQATYCVPTKRWRVSPRRARQWGCPPP